MPRGVPKSGRRKYGNAFRITLNGESKTISEWSEELNIKVSTIRARLGKGWDAKNVLSTKKWFVPGRKSKSYRITNGIPEHRAIAEHAIGKPLPPNAEVHHVDGDRSNNDPSNLVICQDRAYHMLIHLRTKAYNESGDANKRKCVYCGKWDLPKNMTINKTAKHRFCHTIAERQRCSK